MEEKNSKVYLAKGKKAIGTNIFGAPVYPFYAGATDLDETVRFGQGLNRHNFLINNLVKNHGYDLANDFEMTLVAKDLTPEEAEQLETQQINAIPQEASLNVVKVSYFAKQHASRRANKVLSISSYSGRKGTKCVAVVREDGEKKSIVCSYGEKDLFEYCEQHNIPVPTAKELVALKRRNDRTSWVFVTRGVAVTASGTPVATSTTTSTAVAVGTTK